MDDGHFLSFGVVFGLMIVSVTSLIGGTLIYYSFKKSPTEEQSESTE